MMATIPPTDLSLIVREEIVTHLRAQATLDGVVAPVPPDRVFGEQPPALPVKPFVRFGFPIVSAYEHSGRAGSESRLTLNGFSDKEGTKEIYSIANALVRYMSTFLPTGFGLIENEWIGTQYIRDGKEYHAAVEFRFTATQGL